MHVLLCLTGGKVTWDPQSGQAMVTLDCSYRRPHFLYGQSCQGEWGGAHRVTKWGQTMLQTSKNLVDSFLSRWYVTLVFQAPQRSGIPRCIHLSFATLGWILAEKNHQTFSSMWVKKVLHIGQAPTLLSPVLYFGWTSDAHGLWMSSQSLKFPFHLY